MTDLDELPDAPVKSKKAKAPAVEQTGQDTAFMYPTIGEGVTIFARNQAEADELAAKHPLNTRA